MNTKLFVVNVVVLSSCRETFLRVVLLFVSSIFVVVVVV